MKEKTKTPSLVTIAILTTVTIVFWIGFGVYRIFTSKPSSPVPQEVILPLNSNLDMTALNGLQNKMYFSESQIGPTVIQPVSQPAPTPEATETETEIIPEEETPIATGEGELEEGETINEEI